MTLADFQQKTADRIVDVFHGGQRRVLLADEVGLGKTIVARAVIKQIGDWHRDVLNDDHFKVVYICSNISIASQNAQKLGIKDQMNISESRLSMQHLKIYQSAGTGHDYEQLIPLTPATSFSMTNGGGSISERALMFAHLWRLPALSGYKEKLYRFLTYYATKGWPSYVDWYEKLVVDCDGNGSHYLSEMAEALEKKLADQPALIPAIKANCDADTHADAQSLIRRLRLIFAEISLDKLDPDFVIMDEFQRFRDLIAAPKDSEENLLSQRFLQNTGTKVLLLSATPYKPYSTLEEIAEDESSDHYHEFMEVMDFLLCDKNKQSEFHAVWRDYSATLYELRSDDLTVLRVLKDRKKTAEDALYECVSRTERFNTGIIDDGGVKEVCVTAGDILSCDAMQRLMDTITKQNPKALHWRSIPIDYVKSSPYLLTFMENYQLKKQIRDFCLGHPEFSVKHNTAEQYLLLKKSAIHSYRPIAANNARLDALKEIVFSDGKLGSESLLWMPPSRPYYHTGGVFERNRDFSKVLVFSAWEMVPRMISIMLSYEAERLTIGKLFNSAKTHRGRGYFASKEERRFGIGRLKKETEEILCLVSATLAELYNPTEQIGSDLRALRRLIRSKIQPLLDNLKDTWEIAEDQRAGASDLIECIKALDGDPDAHPVRIPPDAAEWMTEMAISSPALCAYRMFLNGAPDRPDECAQYARDISKEVFVSLFNKAESSAVLDLLYGQGSEEAYYQNVFRYCAEGNLQAVLDEYAHVLNLTGAQLKAAILDSIADTVSLPIDVQETFPSQKKTMMRSHFAVGYYNAKVSDDAVARVDRMRKAFNSPFRPFVLATTSIGQEGLDFHYYCRKVMHWNLPSNPIDLEQREGRINRYKCLAVRQNVARRYGSEARWEDMFDRAAKELKGQYPDLVPYWCLPDMDDSMVKIERIVPMYPYSQDQLRYERIIKILSLYRLTLGQPRQEELISILDKELADGQDSGLFMNLSPYYHWKETACEEESLDEKSD